MISVLLLCQFFCRFKFFLQKRDFGFITELCRDRKTRLSALRELPPSLRIITLIGFPLARHMTTPFSRFCHRTLAEWGPNDGTTSLSDVTAWPGEVYPVWGADHYFRPESLARSLISAVLCDLAGQRCPAAFAARSFIEKSCEPSILSNGIASNCS
jgi:hypothetical protein